MGFDQFVTTYRKDYLWPYVKTLGLKPPPEHLYGQNGQTRKACPCQCKKVLTPTSEQIQQLGPPAADQEDWSRLGPMGPLLDPKLYPAKITTPSSEVGRYAQPNVFLDKLQQKYPFIYECLKTAPPDDLLSRINKERLRSTYQVDYSKMREYPSGPYDELLRAAGVAGLQPSAEPVRLPGDPYRPLQKTKLDVRIKSKTCAQIARGSEKARDCVGTCSGPLAIMTAGATEYQDAIARLGTFIIMDRIHERDSQKNRISV